MGLFLLQVFLTALHFVLEFTNNKTIEIIILIIELVMMVIDLLTKF